MKYAVCDNANNICTDSVTMITGTAAAAPTTTSATNHKILQQTMSPAASSGFLSDSSPTPPTGATIGGNYNSSLCGGNGNGNNGGIVNIATGQGNTNNSANNSGMLFSEEFRTVENLFEKWSDCERTVVLYALLKRLRYPCLKFLQYSIDNNLTQHAVAQSTMNAVIADINANNPSYLQNLLNAYNNLHHFTDFHFNGIVEVAAAAAASSLSPSLSTSSSMSVGGCGGGAGAGVVGVVVQAPSVQSSSLALSSLNCCTNTTSATNNTITSDKDSMPCYGTAAVPVDTFQLKLNNCDQRKIYAKKEDILNEVLNILPLLKPGNEDAKTIYISLIPNAVNDTIKQIVPAELVQQIFSYLLIHPAVTSDDRRSLNVWLRQLEDFLYSSQCMANSFFMPSSSTKSDFHNSNSNSLMSSDSMIVNSICSASSTSPSNSAAVAVSANMPTAAVAASSSSSNSVAGLDFAAPSSSNALIRNADWQTIAPPSKLKQQQLQSQSQQHLHHLHHSQQQQPKIPQLTDWCDALALRRQSSGAIPASCCSSMADQLCDNFNGITLNGELSSSQSTNSLGLGSLVEDTTPPPPPSSLPLPLSIPPPPAVAVPAVHGGVGIGGIGASVCPNNESSLANGVAAAAASAESALFSVNNGVVGGGVAQTNPIINIISNANCDQLISDDHDTSFSKNGTDLDFEPPISNNNSSINQFATPTDTFGCSPQPPFASLFLNQNHHNIHGQLQQPPHHQHHLQQQQHDNQLDVNRCSLDSKIAAMKTRRSNSLTTQTISTSTSKSSSNSSVITVNDNCSNSTEDLAQFANKPRSFSLSIENQQRGALINGSSDTRLDDFKPNYVKFQTRNVGMSSIGAWLKSLRLHKYIELFHNMTYEEMLQISEEFLQNVGVTKGASHKLALCIDKLKERSKVLVQLEQDLLSGQVTMHKAVEDLTNIVLTPMKPVEAVNATLGEDNVALMFLRVVDLVCSIVQRDPYAVPEDDNLSSIIWILDRAIHCEAFVNHINQLKDWKFKISKLKIAFAPRLHYNKNGSGGNGNGGNSGGGNGAGGNNGGSINKARWNGKQRKCDSKNGSNDRINYRKNSGDIMNLPMGNVCNGGGGPVAAIGNAGSSSGGLNMSKQQQQQQNASMPNIDRSQIPNNNMNSNYANYAQQAQTNAQQQQQQSGRSMANLIVVAGGPQTQTQQQQQQPQKVIYKNGGGGGGHQQQGVLSMSHTTATATSENAALISQQQQQQQHQAKKTMAAVVMENLSKFDQHFTLF